MDDRLAIEEKLRRKEAEIRVLEDKLKAARVYVQALRDVLGIMDSDENEPSTRSSDTILRPGSAVAQARDVILARGEPVHINDLLAAQGKTVTRENRASLTSSLSAYVRRAEIFDRPAPNTFGLIELDHKKVTQDVAAEPPPEFGKAPDVEKPEPRKSLAEELEDEIPF